MLKCRSRHSCSVQDCDFIVWTKKDVFVERIKPDVAFMEEKLLEAEHFFRVAVLPELLGHWISRPPEHTTSSTSMSSKVSSSSSNTQCIPLPTFSASSTPTTSKSRSVVPTMCSSTPVTQSITTATAVVPPSSQTNSTTDIYCYCKQGEYGTMIMCDNEGCEIGWFHLACLRLKREPKSAKWYCPDCKKHLKKTKC